MSKASNDIISSYYPTLIESIILFKSYAVNQLSKYDKKMLDNGISDNFDKVACSKQFVLKKESGVVYCLKQG